MSYLNEEVAMERVIVNGKKCVMLSTVPKKEPRPRMVRKVVRANPNVIDELSRFSTPDLMSMLADPECNVGKPTKAVISVILNSRGF